MLAGGFGEVQQWRWIQGVLIECGWGGNEVEVMEK